MKFLIYVILILSFGYINAFANDTEIEKYIKAFDYDARKEMKIDSKALIILLKKEKAQLIDIRFKEEYEAWKVSESNNIPLNELPGRLSELKKDKLIVTACPHKDRAALAMLYLRSKGIKAKYLTNGLIGLAENLRGDNAKDFINTINK